MPARCRYDRHDERSTAVGTVAVAVLIGWSTLPPRPLPDWAGSATQCGSPAVHRQNALTRTELRRPVTVEQQQAHDPAALASIRLEELDHALVGRSWLARQCMANDVLEVVVADGDRVGFAHRRHEHGADGPLADAAQQQELLGTLG